MKFIADNGFQTPTWLIDTDILRKLEPNGEVTRIVNAQSAIISNLLNDGKMTRLIENEALSKNPSEVYTLAEMLGDLRHGVFTEIYGSGVAEDRRLSPRVAARVSDRRRQQDQSAAGRCGRCRRAWRRRWWTRWCGSAPANTGEIKMMLRGELKELDAQAAAAIKRTTDRTTKLHLENVRHEISDILKPKASASGGASADEEGIVRR